MPRNELITTRTRLGFIGLGYLGSRIAARLVDAGFPLMVCDRDAETAAQFSKRGAELAANPGELAREVEIVLSCLPDDEAVEDVYLGAGKFFGTTGRYKTVIELIHA